ncbi:hypothetical protein BX666DRAFT_496871 [Dichotomocladium elegans]|nr:hypothetical protein BX666DRAFT_496871 [Dichotomocladium elegans]
MQEFFGKNSYPSLSSFPNPMWFARTYNPLQTGSIDGTDVTPHDHAIKRALNAHCALKYYYPDESPKGLSTDPLKTIFVGRLDFETTKAHIELVHNVVTGTFEGYGFITFEHSRDARNAYEQAHHAILNGREILVDYERSRIMKGWVPRRLGGGFGGRKESGQLRFGARDKPFRQPIKRHGQTDPVILPEQRRPDNWRRLNHRHSSRSPHRSRRTSTPPSRDKYSSRSRYSSPPRSSDHRYRHSRRSPSRQRFFTNRHY